MCPYVGRIKQFQNRLATYQMPPVAAGVPCLLQRIPDGHKAFGGRFCGTKDYGHLADQHLLRGASHHLHQILEGRNYHEI